MPVMKTPNNGPNVEPTRPIEACNTVPKLPTPKDMAIERTPYDRAEIILTLMVKIIPINLTTN